MERTESIVIQVAPDYENEKIRETELFGWNLQGRQELHEEGEAFAQRSIWSDDYIIKTKVYNYVKLHFVRDLNLPNLKEIHKLEDQYYSLSVPKYPSLIPPGGIFGFILWFCLMIFWTFYYLLIFKKRKSKADDEAKIFLKKRDEILLKLSDYIK